MAYAEEATITTYIKMLSANDTKMKLEALDFFSGGGYKSAVPGKQPNMRSVKRGFAKQTLSQ
jgi:hypothetical protein